jgi:hypothetical protein
MKFRLFLFIISASLLTAQSLKINHDSVSSSQAEVNIHDIVRRQIENAKLKQSAAAVQEPAPVPIKAKSVQMPPAAGTGNNPAVVFYLNLPLQYQLFISLSAFVLLALISRRTVIALKMKTSRALKNKIALLREEKVIGRVDSKLNQVRKKLKESRSLFDTSEKQISKLAKELKIAKGELLLASRLKLFEIGKM